MIAAQFAFRGRRGYVHAQIKGDLNALKASQVELYCHLTRVHKAHCGDEIASPVPFLVILGLSSEAS